MKRKLIIQRCVVVAAFALSLCWCEVAVSQKLKVEFGRNLRVVQQRPFGTQNREAEPEIVASLKTDPELESSLELANRYRDDGNFNAASQLWQAVLRQSGDTLFSEDEQTYYSLIEQVESTIAELPPEGLQVYRISADANAREIMAASRGDDDVEALNQVVRQYFISSLGDEAAFQLGCIYLDRFDFIGAKRIFEKLLRIYPDLSIAREEIEMRLALCNSFLGNLLAAEQNLQFVESNGQGDSLRIAQQIRESLGSVSVDFLVREPSKQWEMPLGGPRRYGVMTDVPAEAWAPNLEAKWQCYFEPRERGVKKAADGRVSYLAGENGLSDANGTVDRFETSAIRKWKENSWRPAGRLLFRNGKVYYKTVIGLLAFDVQEIAQSITSPDGSETQPVWRSLWNNAFKLDTSSRMHLAVMRGNNQLSRGGKSKVTEPVNDGEIWMFGDAVFQQMSIQQGVLYVMEGDRFELRDSTPTFSTRNAWNVNYRRSRENFLTAYDAESGKALWRLPRTEAGEQKDAAPRKGPPEYLETGGFMSAPVAYGDYLLTAVNQGGAISIMAIDPRQKGKTVWHSFLCDEPENSAAAWAPVNLTIDGSDLFVTCGMGVVFVLDPGNGMIRFAQRYSRVVKKNRRGNSRWNNRRSIFNGWNQDLVIPYRRQMICFSSDTDRILALDRNSGETIWEFAFESHYGLKVDYLLGVHDHVLYAAGDQTIVAIDLETEGRLLWGGDQMFEGKSSTGHGMLTAKGIFIPAGDSIFRYDLRATDDARPKMLGVAKVDLGTGAPVGNLFSDGNRIWVHGANRLYALGMAKGKQREKSEAVDVDQKEGE